MDKRTEAQLSLIASVLDRAGVDWETVEKVAKATGQQLAPHCDNEAAEIAQTVEDFYQSARPA